MKTKSSSQLRNKTIAVIGLGQIGGSILKRLARHRPKLYLLAHDRDRRLASRAAPYGEWITGLDTVVERSDIIIIATPVPSIISLLRDIAGHVSSRKKKLLVLNTGTVQQAVAAEAAKHKHKINHAGFHPLAGAEGRGWNSSRADLLASRRIVITPQAMARLPVVRALANALDAQALPMDAKSHDRYVAEAIGLPHLLAFAAQGMSAQNPLRAGSWASLTRVAAANPEMVAGFLNANAAEQRKALARFEKELALLKGSLSDRSGKTLIRRLVQRQREDG